MKADLGEQAGLKTGDVIKAVDGTDVTEKETSDIASMVRDSDKDFVTLTIQREDEEKTQNIKVEIRDVEIQTVSHEMLVRRHRIYPDFRVFRSDQ